MLPTMCLPRRLILFFIVVEFLSDSSEREHRVHNIVLYPEKHSWCQLTPIQQIIASPGFDSVTIDNNVCVGACYSYSIPKTEPAEPGELIGPYCDSCQPSRIECYHVNLSQDDNAIEGPKILQKRVQIISNCSCQSCNKIRMEDCQISDENTIELPRNLFTNQEANSKSQGNEEIPDILGPNSVRTGTRTHNYKTWAQNHHEEAEQLYRLFLEQNKDDNVDTEENVESNQSDISSENVMDIISSQHSFLVDQNENNNAKIEQDLKTKPLEYGIEGAPSGHRGNHVAMGLGHHGPTTHDEIGNGVPEERPESAGNRPHDHHHSHHHHHHRVGDVEYQGSNVLHLVTGPHGSMVAAPVKTKLHIDSDDLKPNSEGVVIDYGNPGKGLGDTVAELFEH